MRASVEGNPPKALRADGVEKEEDDEEDIVHMIAYKYDIYNTKFHCLLRQLLHFT
jgi:hypothetical protein